MSFKQIGMQVLKVQFQGQAAATVSRLHGLHPGLLLGLPGTQCSAGFWHAKENLLILPILEAIQFGMQLYRKIARVARPSTTEWLGCKSELYFHFLTIEETKLLRIKASARLASSKVSLFGFRISNLCMCVYVLPSMSAEVLMSPLHV